MKSFLVLFGLFAISSAATWVNPVPSTHPDHPGKCYFPEYKAAVKPGEYFNEPGYCSQLSCHHDFTSRGRSCGKRVIDDPSGHCKMGPGDLSKPYPKCCPEPVCLK